MESLSGSCSIDAPSMDTDSQTDFLFLTPPSSPDQRMTDVAPDTNRIEESYPPALPTSNSSKKAYGETQVTSTNIDRYIKQKYYESLYISNTPISYFAKSTLSRARAVCGINLNAKQHLDQSTSAPHPDVLTTLKGIQALVSALAVMVLALNDLDSKYERENFLHAATSIGSRNGANKMGNGGNTENTADNFWNSENGSPTMPGFSGFSSVATGAYEEIELKCLKFWKKATLASHPHIFSQQTDAMADVDENDGADTGDLSALIEKLKIREIQLQLIIVLEILALHQVYRDLQDQLPAKSQSLDDTNRTQQKKKSKKKPKRRLAIGPAASKRKQASAAPSIFSRPMLPASRYVDDETSHNQDAYGGETDEDEDDDGARAVSAAKELFGLVKKTEWEVHSDILFDRLCIWQAIAAPSLSVPLANRRHTSLAPLSSSVASSWKSPAQIAAESDKAQEFCREVLLPFFSSRLHEKCKSFVKTAKGISGRSSRTKSGVSETNYAPDEAPGRMHSMTGTPVNAPRGAAVAGHSQSFVTPVSATASSLQLQLQLEERPGSAMRKKSMPMSLSSSVASLHYHAHGDWPATQPDSSPNVSFAGSSAGPSPATTTDSFSAAAAAATATGSGSAASAATATGSVSSASAASRRRSGFFSSAKVVTEDRRQFAFVRRKKSSLGTIPSRDATAVPASELGPAQAPAKPKRFGASFATATTKLTSNLAPGEKKKTQQGQGIVVGSTPKKRRRQASGAEPPYAANAGTDYYDDYYDDGAQYNSATASFPSHGHREYERDSPQSWNHRNVTTRRQTQPHHNRRADEDLDVIMDTPRKLRPTRDAAPYDLYETQRPVHNNSSPGGLYSGEVCLSTPRKKQRAGDWNGTLQAPEAYEYDDDDEDMVIPNTCGSTGRKQATDLDDLLSGGRTKDPFEEEESVAGILGKAMPSSTSFSARLSRCGSGSGFSKATSSSSWLDNAFPICKQ